MVVATFWFWFIVIGLLLMIVAALVSGGMNQTTGWTWAVFVVGAVLALIGFIWGIICWVQGNSQCGLKGKDCGGDYPGLPENITYVPQTHIDLRSPVPQTQIYVDSPNPIAIQTNNIPQSQRGFTTTSLNLSSLAPQ